MLRTQTPWKTTSTRSHTPTTPPLPRHYSHATTYLLSHLLLPLSLATSIHLPSLSPHIFLSPLSFYVCIYICPPPPLPCRQQGLQWAPVSPSIFPLFLSFFLFRMTFACLHFLFGLCRQARAKESRRKRRPEAQVKHLRAHPQLNVTAPPGTHFNSMR
jgi:hypothetical protein